MSLIGEFFEVRAEIPETFFERFLGDLETTKGHFDIKLPLAQPIQP